MTGIDRLRAIAGAWDEWGLGGTLAEIADEIEHERAEDCYRMGLDYGTVWRVVANMERHCLGHEGMEDSPVARWASGLREALEGRADEEVEDVATVRADAMEAWRWVREQGGLEAVEARLMPEGCKWPRYDDDGPVMFGDCVENRYGTCTVDSVRFYVGGGVTVYGEDRDAQFVVVTEPVMREPIKRAKHQVLAADGEPLEVGQTVYNVGSSEERLVDHIEYEGGGTPNVYYADGGWDYPDLITHQRPVLDAEGNRIEPAMNVWWVCEGDERGIHAEKLHVDSIGDDGLVTCDPFNSGTWVELEPSELYVHKPVLDADGVPIKKGDTVWEVDGTGHAFEVVGIRPDTGRAMEPTVITCDVGDGTSEHFLPSQLTHTKPEIDSWEKLWDDIEDCNVGHESFMRRCRALAERERGE